MSMRRAIERLTGLKVRIDFDLQDDGGGPYISAWRSVVAQPTEQQIADMMATIAAEPASVYLGSLVDDEIRRDVAFRALIKVLAQRFSLTNAQVVAAIKAQVNGM